MVGGECFYTPPPLKKGSLDGDVVGMAEFCFQTILDGENIMLLFFDIPEFLFVYQEIYQ